MVDRIDIHTEVPRMDYEKLSGDKLGGSSESIRKRVQATRGVQSQRFIDFPEYFCNADMCVGKIWQFCKLLDEVRNSIRAEMSQMSLLTMACYRILELARTIANLPGSHEIQSAHLAEALQYRPKIMMG